LQEEQALIPIEQQIITFYGKPIIVVRLPDGRPGVVLRYLCDNLQLDPGAQVARVKRTEAIAEDLVHVQVQTDGGPQIMPTLVFHAVPFWLAGIDPKRVREEVRPDVLHYQREVVDVLYAWASKQRTIAASASLVTDEPITEPTRPASNAPSLAWADYHLQMAAFYQWKATTDTRLDVLEEWQGSVDSRLDEHRRVLAFIPEIIERLGPETLTPAHKSQVQTFVKQLSKATGKPYQTIHDELRTAFQVGSYQEIREAEWDKVENWFQVQLQRANKE